jgi:hypothetical protein
MYLVRVRASQRLIPPLAAQSVIAALFTVILATENASPDLATSLACTSSRERTCLQMTRVPSGVLVSGSRDELSVQIGSKGPLRCRGLASGQIARRLSTS